VRKNYAVLGVAGAVLVVVSIVVLGPHSPRTKAGSPSTATSLPPGHPQVGSTSQAEATQAARVAAIVKRLAAKYAADPSDMRNLMALAYAYFLDQEYDKAAAAYDTVLKRQPGNVTARVQRAIVWHAQGDDARAIAALDAVIKAQPGNQEAHTIWASSTSHGGSGISPSPSGRPRRGSTPRAPSARRHRTSSTCSTATARRRPPASRSADSGRRRDRSRR